ncbi:site-specific integrase [Paenibacillus wynnii]|uniref:Integrase n=1 Tax=Paenibacillus wynnii TaxID=268407 RepID=A0A098M3N5_9BACL|nr:tyrosine-type recombinase/integrase [Paenibacillus wynnii]KGE16633.1 hypothetical protein PWYN_18145 [Paenibacillus wynnii]
MANIQKRGDNSWCFTVYTGVQANGKYGRRTKTLTITDEALLKTKKRLQDHLDTEFAKFREEVQAGEFIAPQKLTFLAFTEEWRSKYAEKQLGKATLEIYMIHLHSRIIPELGHMKLDAIKTLHLVDLMDRLSTGERKDGKEGTLSAGTVQYLHRVLRNIFSRAVDWKLLKVNPMDGVKKPRDEPRELNVYTQQETDHIFTLLEAEKDSWCLMITLALTTGLRRGELLGLEWKNINLDAGTMDVLQSLSFTKSGYELKEPKTKASKRRIELPLSLIPDLRSYKAKCNEERLACADLWEGGEQFFVFNSWKGKPLNPYSVKTWWTRFTKRHNLRYVNFHALRHTSATLLLNQGLHAKIIQARLGHANISTTLNIYTHALREADQAAAGIFDKMLKASRQSSI